MSTFHKQHCQAETGIGLRWPRFVRF